MTDTNAPERTWNPKIDWIGHDNGIVTMVPAKGGMWVSVSDYAALEAQIATLTAERDKDARFIKEMCDQIEQLNARVGYWSMRAEIAEVERDAARGWAKFGLEAASHAALTEKPE